MASGLLVPVRDALGGDGLPEIVDVSSGELEPEVVEGSDPDSPQGFVGDELVDDFRTFLSPLYSAFLWFFWIFPPVLLPDCFFWCPFFSCCVPSLVPSVPGALL